MKNTKRKDFHTFVKVGTLITMTYEGRKYEFTNERSSPKKTLWDMCEYIIGYDLQNFWDGQLDLSESNWDAQTKEEERLMNLVKIEL